ncbi:NADPH-dependent FMN reductase [Deinococcus piscis]|nr:NADPH-dependent FMN reductase [Deinococcus piscis]
MNLLLLSGSLREGSVNGATLQTVQRLAPASLSVRIYSGTEHLPYYSPDLDHDPLPPAVQQLRGAVAEADAVLMCTPEYAGALPGAFKNLLEWTVGSVVMNDKSVAWINVSTAPTEAKDAHASLRLVLGYVGAQVIEDACLPLPVPRSALGPDGLIHDP